MAKVRNRKGKLINYEPSKDEIIKTYQNRKSRLAEIPEELKKLDEHMVLVKKDLNFKLDECRYRIEDFTIRIGHFKVIDPKFEWEFLPEWADNQKMFLKLEIDKAEMSKTMHERSLIETEKSINEQKIKVLEQKARCEEDFNKCLDLFKDSYKMSQEDIDAIPPEPKVI